MIWGLFAVTTIIWLAAIFFLIKGWSGSDVSLEEFAIDSVDKIKAQPDIVAAGTTRMPEPHEETVHEDEIEIPIEDTRSEEEVEISIPEPVHEEPKPVEEVKPPVYNVSEVEVFDREFSKANMVEFPAEYVDSESIRSLSGKKIHIIEFAKNCYSEIGFKCIDTLTAKIINGKAYRVSIFDLLSNHYFYTEDAFISYFGQMRDSFEEDINSINAHPEISESNRKALSGRYEGLPQLLAWNERELFLILVKSKDDKLTEKEVGFLKEFVSEKKLLKAKIFRVTEKKLMMPSPEAHAKEDRPIQSQFDKAAKLFSTRRKSIETKSESEKIKSIDKQSLPEDVKPIEIMPVKPVVSNLEPPLEIAEVPEAAEEEKKVRRKPFTKDEILFLKENKDKMTNEELAAQLGRSLDSVTHKLSRLNLARESYSWTPEKNEFLRTNLTSLTYKELAEKLGTTIPSVRARCKKLGINK